MADITMCLGTDCPFKYKCYRALANASEYYQSYFTVPPYKESVDSCDEFWDLAKRCENTVCE